MWLLSFNTPRLPRYPLQTSVWLVDLMQGAAPKCRGGEVSDGGTLEFPRESQIKTRCTSLSSRNICKATVSAEMVPKHLADQCWHLFAEELNDSQGYAGWF